MPRHSADMAGDGASRAPCSAPVLGQPKFVNLPKLFFRNEVCSEMGDDSMEPFLVRKQPSPYLSHPLNWNTKERKNWLPGNTWVGRQMSGPGCKLLHKMKLFCLCKYCCSAKLR